jgi:hypothetical protein
MRMPVFGKGAVARHAALRIALTACLLTMPAVTQARGAIGHADSQIGQLGAGGSTPIASATLEQCVTAVVQAERSATFSGEMTAIPGTARMAMRIDVQERLPGEVLFHTVTAPGLGVWRTSDVKVKLYKYLKQVTDLSAPALYRASVHFRWLNARGHAIRRAERLTPRCDQPASPPPLPAPTTEPSSATSTTTPASA